MVGTFYIAQKIAHFYTAPVLKIRTANLVLFKGDGR